VYRAARALVHLPVTQGVLWSWHFMHEWAPG
jgi:hypothetical protein